MVKKFAILLFISLTGCSDIPSINYEIELKKLNELYSEVTYFKDINERKDEILNFKEIFCPNIEPRLVRALILDDLLLEGGNNFLDAFVKKNPLISNDREYPIRLASVIRLKKIHPETFRSLHESIKVTSDIQELESMLNNEPFAAEDNKLSEEQIKLMSVFGCLMPTYYLGLIGKDKELDELSRTILIEYFVQESVNLNMEATRIKNQLERHNLLE